MLKIQSPQFQLSLANDEAYSVFDCEPPSNQQKLVASCISS